MTEETPRRGPGRPRKEPVEAGEMKTIRIGWRSVWTTRGVKTKEEVTLPAAEADEYIAKGVADGV